MSTSRNADTFDLLCQEIVACRSCPRLVAWREQVARERRAAFSDQQYWGRPVPGFGDRHGRLMVLGLAPAAHGANRTGRMFTGDRSGDWLYAALNRTGFANQATSLARDDGLALDDAFVSASVRCAPPANLPSVHERDACQPFLERELALMTNVRVIVALGQFAFDAARRVLERQGQLWPKPRPRFGHGVEVSAGRYAVLGSYHPSQQNTFTGKLTEQMFDSVFVRARVLLAQHPRAPQRNIDVNSPPA